MGSGFYPSQVPDDAKELFMNMFLLNPRSRLNLQEIRKTSFFNGVLPSAESVKKQMLEKAKIAWLGQGLPSLAKVLHTMRNQKKSSPSILRKQAPESQMEQRGVSPGAWRDFQDPF